MNTIITFLITLTTTIITSISTVGQFKAAIVLAEWDVSLVIVQDSSGAIGGEPFITQPLISIYDLKGLTKYTNLDGRVVATLEQSPYHRKHHDESNSNNSQNIRNELLGLENSNGQCHVDDQVELSTPLINGDASFVGLCVNIASDGYSIKYTLMDEYNITLGYVRGAEFTVSTGNPYQIGVVQSADTVYGGTTWDTKSIVAVQDRGRNTVPSVNEGTVSIALATNADNSILIFEEDNPSLVTWKDGIASFDGTYINNAGIFNLNFTTDLNLPGSQQCSSKPISVHIGEPNELIVLEEPIKSTVYGGKPFHYQPKLHIIDRGGNIVKSDFTSNVVVSLYSNPSNASLSPPTSKVANAYEGIVQFKHLNIDKAGVGYRMMYELFVIDTYNNIFIETNITTLGSFFNVEIGIPNHIELSHLPSPRMWAGNQPFLEQPAVALVDAGGNIVNSESGGGTMDAILVKSLSQSSDIVIDTSKDSEPSIESVQFHQTHKDEEQTVYSAGHNISIVVTFTQEVNVKLSEDVNSTSPLLPSLKLNVLDENGTRSRAYLVTEHLQTSRYLCFQYTISRGPTMSEVNIFSRSSLETNDYLIMDAWQRNATIYLPSLNSTNSLLSSKNITIHSDPARITNISTSVESDEFGAGHLIDFKVKFDHSVAVQNTPSIPINVNSSIILIDIAELGTSYSKSYYYVWYKDQRSISIPWNASSKFMKEAFEKMSSVLGTVCVSRSTSSFDSSGYRWAVRFNDRHDDFSNGVHIETANVRLDHEASNVSIVQLTTNIPLKNWVTDDGEQTMCTERHAAFVSGSGTDTLTFQYEVLPGDITPSLNFTAVDPVIKVSQTAKIVNSINDGTMSNIDVDLDLQSAAAFFEKEISIDTAKPYVQNITLVGSSLLAERYHSGDSLYFSLKFSKNVVVESHIYFLLNVGRSNNTATYYSGSGTKNIIFRYDVVPKHWSLALSYDYQQYKIMRSGGYIRRVSHHPTTNVDLNLPSPLVPFMQNLLPIRVDGRTPVIIDIFVSDNQSNYFTERDNISITVEFSSEVTFSGGPPVLALSLGGPHLREAPYVSGNESNKLKFNYTVAVGDSSPSSPILCRMLCVSSGCVQGVSTEGYLQQYSSSPNLDADLTLPFPTYEMQRHNLLPIYSRQGLVTVNTSGAPLTKIISITSQHEMTLVSIGEAIRIHVTFTDAVFLRGKTPELQLNTNSTALYEYGTSTSTLTFRFVTSKSDVTQRLSWNLLTDKNTPIHCDPNGIRPCSIINANGFDVDLNTINNNGESIGALEQELVIDATVPSIDSVYLYTDLPSYCLNPCNYTAGDQILFFVKFDLPVTISIPGPRIAMKVQNKAPDKGVFAIYDKARSNETDIAFIYSITEGQSTAGAPLEFDCDTETCLIDALGTDIHSVIRRKATFPTLPVNVTLPHRRIIENQVQQAIFIDAVTVPKVIRVESQNGTGIFSPGDEIIIEIIFDEFVHVEGIPRLLLDVGLRQNASAIYCGGSNSKSLVFKYTVEPDHCMPRLDYLDVHSLETNPYGQYGIETSIIRRSSAEPMIMANLKLPIPGSKGSLVDHSVIDLDCSKPHVLAIWSSQEPGKYSTSDNISVMVQFSREVIVIGKPKILLETGKTDRYAHFISQPNNTILEFEYNIQLGDSSDDLDYWTDEGLTRSSSSSFQLNGSTIMLPATTPIVHADCYLNPSFGYLGGQTEKSLHQGVARYEGLKIGKRGFQYIIRFRFFSSHVNLTFWTSTVISIYESAEYHVHGDDFDRESGDLFGATVVLQGKLMAVGAPNKRNPSSEVQVLTVKSDTKQPQHEVQLVTTQLDLVEATKQIQTFTTFADVNSTVAGSFSLTYIDFDSYLYAAPITIPSDIGPIQLETLIVDKFPNLGPLQVSRTKNHACDCTNGWKWRLTFIDSSNPIQLVKTDGGGLTGDGANVSSSFLEKNTTMLDGEFNLRNPLNGATTRNISFDATELEMKTALEDDLGLFVDSVLVANMDERDIPQLGRRWTITFSHNDGPFGSDINVPNLEVEKSLLIGTNALVWTHVGFEGRGPLNGSFAVSFRKSTFSNYIPYDASEEQMKEALESLESINNVTVSGRKDISKYSLDSGFSWTITFHSVNALTASGWNYDLAGESVRGNMPPLKVDSHLTGWNANHIVEYEFGNGKEDIQSQWMAKKMGQDGINGGSVVVYHSDDQEQWYVESFLQASDGNVNDNFGGSLSLEGSFIAVGAPSKEVNGVFEQQTFTCIIKATDGTFTVEFRGHRSDPIRFDASIQQIKDAILGVYGSTTKIHALPEFSIEGNRHWNDENKGFCASNGNNLTITMYTPDGGGVSTMAKNGGDIENFVVDSSNLGGGRILVTESRKGNRALSGKAKVDNSISTLGKQSGSVYLYERRKECEFCQYKWNEVEQLTPIEGLDHLENSAMFGWSTALGPSNATKDLTLMVGSPGFNNASGKVYTFFGQGDEWKYKNSLSSSLWNDVSSGARFGHSLSLDNDTVLVGSPGHNNSKGAVYVFIRYVKEMGFLASQSIYGPPELNTGDEFGYSISLSGDRAVICAPNHNDHVLSGTVREREDVLMERVGSCYVYQRPNSFKPFELMQKLTPTNLSRRNRFGHSCAISGDKIVVGQLEDFLGLAKHLTRTIRGKAHLFSYYDDVWTELSYLFPYDPQKNDLFGSSVAIDNDVAIVGAPNRHLLNIDSGSACIYDLSFSNFYFPINKHYVTEGSSLAIPLRRTKIGGNEIIGYKSIDRNADSFTQDYIAKLFELDKPEHITPIETAIDFLLESKAFGRNHYYGGNDNRSLWVDGMYDYNGISDYQKIDDVQLFLSGSQQQAVLLYTTSDQMYESPDESLSIHVSMPGMFASSSGNLKTDITINDDDDGFEDDVTQYLKLFGNLTDKGDKFGSALDSLDDATMMVVGSEMFTETISGERIEKVGIAYIFKKSSDRWSQSAILAPSLIDKEPKSYFGQSVSITKLYNSDEIIAIVGAPGQARAYVFAYDFTTELWKEESILRPFNESRVHLEHNFAGRGAICVRGNIAFIGASGLETVFIYRRLVDQFNQVNWQPWIKLRSDDYDYDRYDNGYKTHHLHQQLFGISVTAHGRLLLVGAPYADYGNRGQTSVRESHNTDGTYNVGLGKGKVYVFHSSPLILRVSIRSNTSPQSGNFKLSVQYLERNPVTTKMIPYNADSNVLKGIFESLPHFGEIRVQRLDFYDNETNFHSTQWTLVFLNFSHEKVTILPLWKDNGCDECDPIEGANITHINAILDTEKVSSAEKFSQEWSLQGDDVTSGDRFGYNIDLDTNEAIIGAMYSSAKTRTTWDFETGTLAGWVANGNAFDHQPVFGDNSKRRMVYKGFNKPQSETSGFPQSALIQGRYYIGTYEMRPGNISDYLTPDDSITEGSFQDDVPTGTLTSDPFIILGDVISFLIGGGCDHLTEYVELLVDGFVTMRATGRCNERMERIEWQVNNFMHRAAQIRIVDAASGIWGHINVDDITFSWKVGGSNTGCSNTGGVLPRTNSGSKQHYSGQEESPLSGAAYMFVRNCSSVDWSSVQQGTGCTWRQDQRLTPSDKRSGNLFGSSVSIDSRKGLVIIGSEHAPLYDMHKQTPSLYPHNEPTIRFPLDQRFEYLMKTALTLSPSAGNLRVTNFISKQNSKGSSFITKKYSEKAGATYIYKRTQASRASDGSLLRVSFWQSFEHAKITPPHLSGNDLYGNNVKITGETTFVTATGDKSCCGTESGAAFIFDLKWYQLRFSKIEYEALEGRHDQVSIQVLRDQSSINTTMTIGYSTSDLSAVGVDKIKVDHCLTRSIRDRNGCGDYEQTSGTLRFEPGTLSSNFTVRIIDDYCWERHMKYVQLNLHIPGGTIIQGEDFRAQLRIDDDDWLTKNTTQFCTNRIL